MAQSSINWNVVIVAGAALGGLYLWQRIKTGESGNTASGYVSGSTGEYISEATQPTIRTDLRQAARTARVIQRKPVASDYVSGVTGETISSASQPTIKTDIRKAAGVSKTEVRQEARTERQENRLEARQTRLETRIEAKKTPLVTLQQVKNAAAQTIVRTATQKPIVKIALALANTRLFRNIRRAA